MVISRLNLKLIRDIRFSPWLFIGIVVVVTLGIALFDASYISYNSLGRSYDLTHDRLNLADFTVRVRAAPDLVERQIRRIPGVSRVEGRVVEDMLVELDGDDRITGRVISLPDRGSPDVNTPYIVRGSLPGPGGARELMIEYSFAKYHEYELGDFIYPVVDDQRFRFRIVGVFMSPEYILPIRGGEMPTPQPEQFGIIYMRKEMADRLLGTPGTVNEVGVTLTPDADRRVVMRQAEELLRPYGVFDVIPREEQPSYEVLQMDLQQLRIMAIFFPILFLAIASLSIYNLLSRMVHAQRAQIGLMRAMGYSRVAVLKHYMGFAMLIGLLGSGIGTLLGYLMAGWIINLYADFISVPFRVVALRYDIMGLGIFISLVISLLAGFLPARAGANLTPAASIRPEAPTVGRVPVLENYIPALRNASFVWRLPFRNLFRAPKRTISTIIGIAASMSLILVVSGLTDSMTAMIEFYFNRMMRYDANVIFAYPQTEAAVSQIKTWMGVRDAEPSMQIGVTMIHEEGEEDVVVLGLPRNVRLTEVIAPDLTQTDVPLQGVAVGIDLMEMLDLSLGQPVTLSLSAQMPFDAALLEGEEQAAARGRGFRGRVQTPIRRADEIEVERQVPITKQIYQPIGAITVMNIDELRRLFGREMELPPNATTSIMVQTDTRYQTEVVSRLEDLPDAVAVVDVAAMRYEIDAMMEFANTFIGVMFSFAVALAFVVLFNATTINILERTRETASLRALGTGRWQIAYMLTIENLSTWLVGTIIGVPFGCWLAASFFVLWQTESFHPRLQIFTATYVLTVVGILATVLVSQLPGIRYLNRLNLASATKEVGG